MQQASGRTVSAVSVLMVLSCAWCLAQDPALVHERTVYSFPPVGEHQVLVGDFHIHTTHSDGSVAPTDRVLEAYRAGFDAIAITDHGNADAYPEVEQLARDVGLILLRGLETGLHGKEHLVALGVSADYQPRDAHSWAFTPEEAQESQRVYYRDQMQEVARCGGVLLYAHPHVGLREPVLWGIEQGFIVGVEVFNSVVGSGWETVHSYGLWCYPFAFDWALEHELAPFANSDIHGPHEKSAPRGRNLVLVTERTPQGVMEAIRQRRVLAWLPAGESEQMLWGRRDLLAAYVHATAQVELREVDLAENGAGTVLRNLGAFPLRVRAVLDGWPVAELTLEQGQEYFLSHTQVLAGLTLEWLNLWATPQDNLVTGYRAVYRGGRRVWLPGRNTQTRSEGVSGGAPAAAASGAYPPGTLPADGPLRVGERPQSVQLVQRGGRRTR